MKVYLVNPRYPDTFWGFRHVNDLNGMQYCIANLSVPTVAALTPADVEVEICDENVEAVDFETDAEIIGLTSFNIQSNRAFEIAAEFRKRGKLVVMGGPYATLVPQHCRDHVDVLFVGEAELTWPRFLQEYRAGTYSNLYEQVEKVDIKDTPIPRWDLMKIDRYGSVGVQTTRGCPFNCEFCDIIVMLGRKVRTKTVEQVMAELRFLQPLLERAGREDIFFTDDNFIGNKKFAKELLKEIISFNNSLSRKIHFMTELTITLANDEDLLDLLVQANFTRVFVGIESPRTESLNEVAKVQNTRWDMERSIEKIQSHGIFIWAGMIVGFDHDDVHVFREMFDFIQKNKIIGSITGPLSAPINTPLWQRLREEGRLIDDTWSDHGSTNIIPKNMTRQQLYAGYHWIMAEQYTYENYTQRLLGMIDLLPADRPVRTRGLPTWKQVKTLLKTLRYYALTTDWRRQRMFWKVIVACLRRKPAYLDEVLSHVIVHKHMYRHTERLTEGFVVANPADVADVGHTPAAREAQHVPRAVDRAEEVWVRAAS
ncbi:MAG: B12-binding domain-containing radical SAM protein [Candidatus Schekmanbacteria bacterium]|nr:B12-binding domain-containing radical SAM protein [Candidatus Schekmanbacteria bacterium]